MQRIPVTSSNLVSVGYEAGTETLEVEFREARVYQYAQVPEDAYRALMDAPSKGSHFHHHIRDNYRTTRIR